MNGKIYVGKHQTLDPNDEYLGSGRALVAAIKKYGRSSFTKKVLHLCETKEEMNRLEAEIISEEFAAKHDTYNIGVGGEGGPHFKGRKHTPEAKVKFSRLGKTHTKSPGALKRELQGRHERNGGSHFSAETREKIRIKAIEREAQKRNIASVLQLVERASRDGVQ